MDLVSGLVEVQAKVHMDTLAIWENKFKDKLQQIDPSERLKAGALRNVIPARNEWEDFLAVVRAEWPDWHEHLLRYPSSLVVLYDGLAFFEYESKRFWKPFAKASGEDAIDANHQTKINSAYVEAASQFDLKILRGNRTDANGSAVYHVGIPISLWADFLDICDWAFLQENWEKWSDEEWSDRISRRTGGRTRLRNILTANRELAGIFIKEVLSAREILRTGSDMTASELYKACQLRPEYFYDVPETAEFLNCNPEIFFKDRARLFWDDTDSSICLNLPALGEEKRPATWCIGTTIQPAISTPSRMLLNSKTHIDSLELRLEAGGRVELQKIRGLNPWGLFDLNNNGYQASSDREQLPLRYYLLVSHEKLDITCKGFDKEENKINELEPLSDGTQCYITRLMPNGKYAELSLKVPSTGISKKIRFRTRATIETAFFVGKKQFAAHFSVNDGVIKTDSKYPIIAVSVPSSYFDNIPKVLNDKFKVHLDGSLSVGMGYWQKCHIHEDAEKELYEWHWTRDRFIDVGQAVHGIVTDLRNIHKLFKPVSLKGDHKLSLVTPSIEFNREYKIHGVGLLHEFEHCWISIPGPYLVWFLLCQSPSGMKWDDMMIANDLIEPEKRISHYLLWKYEKHGFLRLRGQFWEIIESRASIKDIKSEEYEVDYCGDPSILWGLYRHINHIFNKDPASTIRCALPVIDVLGNKHGEVPYLEMVWPSYAIKEIDKYLRSRKVVIGETLWTP